MARYDFFATKKVSSFGRLIGQKVNESLASLLLSQFGNSPQRLKILEIGPGQGAFAEALLKNANVTYIAYEADAILYKMLTQKGLPVKPGRVPPIPEENDLYDAVVILNVLEHMQNVNEAESLTRELFRVCKTGGIALVVTPSFLSWGKDFYNFDYTHTFVTTELRIQQLLCDTGFAIKKIGYHYGNFFSGFGRIAAFVTRFTRKCCDHLLPRAIGRRLTLQKMAMLFAENIVTIAQKP